MRPAALLFSLRLAASLPGRGRVTDPVPGQVDVGPVVDVLNGAAVSRAKPARVFLLGLRLEL